MSKNYWFTADLHFGHANIIKYSKRPFASVEEHDAILVQNWNNMVRPGDDIFVLGDFCYRNKTGAGEIRERLNGNIHFIEGNHDSAAFQIRNTFASYRSLSRVKVNTRDIVLCHFALRVWDKSHHGSWHLYGHSHNSLPDIDTSLSFDVGVDAVAMRLIGKKQGDPIEGTLSQDYRPMNYDEVAKIMATKTFVPIDHHGARPKELFANSIEGGN